MDRIQSEQLRHKSRGKVLSFEQKGEFFYKRGLDRLDKNDLVEALANYRMALEREPENNEIRMAVAEVLTEMERYEESNRILLAMLREEDTEPECYFGLGCNFMGMNELDRAKDSLERYTELEPEGGFVWDAYDMLDAIDDAQYYESNGGLVEVSRENEAFDAAEEGRALLEREDYDGAETALGRALKLDPKLHYARNNLSLVLYCKREYKRAGAEAKAVLEMEPGNVQALCNLCMIEHTQRDKAGANKTADALMRCDTTEPDELSRMALVLMDLNRFEEAYGVLVKLAREYPYEEGTLHRLGMCAYETGRYQEAAVAYDKLARINPLDTVARYYRGLCRAARINGEAGPRGRKRFMPNYQVPFDELLARINRLNQMVALPREELTHIWQNTQELDALVEWGFTLPDRGIKRALLTVVSSFEDQKGERILRDFILRRDQPDELKHEAFGMLARQHAAEPYIGYIDGSLVESRVSADGLPTGVSKPYKDALALCLATMHGRRSEDTVTAAVVLWGNFIQRQASLPRITRMQGAAMAAALEYLACKETGEKAAKGDVCAKYGVSALRFKNAIDRLTKG